MIDPAGLAFDIDGVVADTMSVFLHIAREDFGIRNIRYEDISDYDIEAFGGLNKIQAMEIILRILSGKYSVPLQPFEGAAEVIRRLNRLHRPTLFVTARPDADQIHDWMLSLLSLAPSDIEVIATGAFDEKAEVLLDRGITSFVEDRLETCYSLSEAGINPILFKQPWNRKPHPFIEVGTWRELEALIAFE